MIREKKKCIGIIFGGNSNEHEVSISSAKAVLKAFDSKTNQKRFKLKVFYIDKKGTWFDNEQSMRILNEKNKQIEKDTNLIIIKDKINFLDKIELESVDIWFPLLHGINGEDGAIHGLLKFTQKPIVGGGILGSALGMDKIIMKKVFSYLQIPQVKYLDIQNQDLNNEIVQQKLLTQIIDKLNFPMFVKPSNSGSSLGISKVKNKSEILEALKIAWEVDTRILIEEGLDVRELECGIIGNSKLMVSEIGEISYANDWYDFESKYTLNNQITIPAEIKPEIANQIKQIAIKSCRALNIFGYARIDFFLEKYSNKVFLNEINTIPGFTSKSMFPMLWKASGLNIDRLVARLVDISIDL